jgi:hypothetical protein
MRSGGVAICLLSIVIATPVAADTLHFPPAPPGYFHPDLRRPSIHCPWARKELSAVSDTEAGWFAEYWLAAGEPSLYLQSRTQSSTKSYRFTWLPSFDAPVFVRVDELASGALRLTATRLTGAGGEHPGAIGGQVVRILTPPEQRQFRRALAQANNLDLPAINCDWGYDGALWIFEANDAGIYRYVKRWTPKGGFARSLGEVFLGLTGWSFRNVC